MFVTNHTLGIDVSLAMKLERFAIELGKIENVFRGLETIWLILRSRSSAIVGQRNLRAFFPFK